MKDIISADAPEEIYNITARKPMVFRPWDEWRLQHIYFT